MTRPCIESDVARCAAMSEGHSQPIEGRAFFGAIKVALLPGQDADGALQAVFHDRVKLVLLRPGDTQVRRPQQCEHLAAARIVIQQLGGQCLPELAAARLGEPEVCETRHKPGATPGGWRRQLWTGKGIRAQQLQDRAAFDTFSGAKLNLIAPTMKQPHGFPAG